MKPEMEIKLKHLFTDVGFCQEVWMSMEEDRDQPRYFGRDTVGHQWSLLADAPDGFCEPQFLVGTHVVFILCDEQGREISRDGRFPLNSKSERDAKIKGWPTGLVE